MLLCDHNPEETLMSSFETQAKKGMGLLFLCVGLGACADAELDTQMNKADFVSGVSDEVVVEPATKVEGCLTEVQGSDSSCKDVATWKQYAYDACAAQGLSLTAYSPYESCGTDVYRYVKYECCGTSTPPPEPTPALCFSDYQGGSTSCKSESTWKKYASEACAAEGMSLVAYSVGEKCGLGRYRTVKYQCCVN